MTDSLEQKRQAASDYLRSRGIHRADVDCKHRYESRPHTPPPPRIDIINRLKQHTPTRIK